MSTNVKRLLKRNMTATDTPPATRICKECKEEKALDLFEKDKKMNWGRTYRCRKCLNIIKSQRLPIQSAPPGTAHLCRQCGERKALDQFVKDPRRKYGRTSCCKKCKNLQRSQFVPEDPPPGIVRTCRECGEEKALDQFTKRPQCVYGRSHICRICENEKNTLNRRQLKLEAKSTPPPDTRTCSKCGATKAFALFTSNANCRWGRSHVCWACQYSRLKVKNSDLSQAPETLTCGKCGEEKPFTAFIPNLTAKWGRSLRCYECHREHANNYRLENPEAVKRQIELRRQWYKDNPLKAAIHGVKSVVRRSGKNPDTLPPAYIEVRALSNLIKREIRRQRDEECN